MRTIGTIILALILTCNIATAQDTLYIYKSGMVVNKRAVAEIDSVIFYKAATIPQGNTVTDFDGNVYHSVTIGTQVWMVENLKTTKCRDGSPIPNVTDNTQWGNRTTGAYCNYDNDAAIGTKYGKLYNWYAVDDSRNIAPTGWHVPTDAEWTTLDIYLSANLGTSGSVAKALASKTDWASSTNGGAIGNDLTQNNTSGFTALPGGYRYGDGTFNIIGDGGSWWSSTESGADGAWGRHLIYSGSSMSRNYSLKSCGFSVRCVRDESQSAALPTITTVTGSAITSTTALSGGNITSDGGAVITARGLCWATTLNPTTSDSKTNDGAGAGSFTSSMTNLTAGTLYYVRSYATNSAGTAYGNQLSFTTTATGTVETVTDIDGNIYHSVTIGTQVWMVENLKTTKYRDGSPIPNVTDNNVWVNLTTGAYCNYDNDAAIGTKYGKLYNWYAVDDSRNIAPTGWHVPTDAEWTTLENYVSANLGTSGSVAKALASKTDWASSTNGGAIGNDLTKNNTTGFTALPGGDRDYSGSCNDGGGSGIWWSSTEVDTDNAWNRFLLCLSNYIYRNYNDKSSGFSVRCVRDL